MIQAIPNNGNPSVVVDSGQAKVYQVHIRGRLHPDIGLDGDTSMVSRKVFTSRAAAEAHAPDFTGLCTVPRDERDMNYIDPSTATTKVVELELHAGDKQVTEMMREGGCPQCGSRGMFDCGCPKPNNSEG